MEIAKCYGVWGDKYYRTESGKTFCKRELYDGTEYITYFGNAITNETFCRQATKDDLQGIIFED